MTHQVVFNAKNVPRFSFWLLVSPKLKKPCPPVNNVFQGPVLDRVKKLRGEDQGTTIFASVICSFWVQIALALCSKADCKGGDRDGQFCTADLQ